LITAGSSILAITLTAPPHSSQVVISILNTRLRRCAFIPSGASHRGVTICGCAVICLTVFLVLVTLASLRRRHQGTVFAIWTVRRPGNTPWKRVRLALGRGIRAASRAAHRLMRKYLIYQQSRTPGHAARTAWA
jgi:hypothetical protein